MQSLHQSLTSAVSTVTLKALTAECRTFARLDGLPRRNNHLQSLWEILARMRRLQPRKWPTKWRCWNRFVRIKKIKNKNLVVTNHWSGFWRLFNYLSLRIRYTRLKRRSKKKSCIVQRSSCDEQIDKSRCGKVKGNTKYNKLSKFVEKTKK